MKGKMMPASSLRPTKTRSNSSAQRDSTIIDLRQVVKTYETPSGPFTAIQEISLQVHAGEFVAVVGKSGSGKSTLLNLLAGIESGVVAPTVMVARRMA